MHGTTVCSGFVPTPDQKQTFCHFWWSRRWPRGRPARTVGLPVKERNSELRCWCCPPSAWTAPPLWWCPQACAQTPWGPLLSAARSKWDLNSNRREMYGAKVNDRPQPAVTETCIKHLIQCRDWRGILLNIQWPCGWEAIKKMNYHTTREEIRGPRSQWR